jgi:sugar (pentulose or hexulose) kinase
MSIRNLLAMFFGVALVLLAFGPTARADVWNQMTKLTFSQPVQIPGNEVLPAGSYWFVLASGSADRNIVQVYSSNWQHEYAMLLTQPTIRRHVTDHTRIEFAERPHKQPEALLKWYYPGRVTGHEFLYSARHEREFSHDIKENVGVNGFSTRS